MKGEIYLDLHKPKVYGDQLMELLADVGSELDKKDQDFILNEQLSLYEDDAQNYARIRRAVVCLHADLATDSIRGDNALIRMDKEIFFPYKDLIYRLVESSEFPFFSKLYYFFADNFI